MSFIIDDNEYTKVVTQIRSNSKKVFGERVERVRHSQVCSIEIHNNYMYVLCVYYSMYVILPFDL